MLMGYKESPVDEVRRHYARCVGVSFAAFFAADIACVRTALGGGVDLVAPVPSSSRPGRASLEGADGLADIAVSALGPVAQWLPSTLQRAGGVIGPMRPNVCAFVVPDSRRATVNGARVILLDDIYVSGSARRAQRPRSVSAVPARCSSFRWGGSSVPNASAPTRHSSPLSEPVAATRGGAARIEPARIWQTRVRPARVPSSAHP